MASARGTVPALALGWMVLAITSLGLPGAAWAVCARSGQFALVEAGSGSGVEWRLTRGGEPFFVKGVVGPNQSCPAGGLAEFVSSYGAGSIAAMGGNALKTYGSDVKFGSDAVVQDYLAALQAACDAGVGGRSARLTLMIPVRRLRGTPIARAGASAQALAVTGANRVARGRLRISATRAAAPGQSHGAGNGATVSVRRTARQS